MLLFKPKVHQPQTYEIEKSCVLGGLQLYTRGPERTLKHLQLTKEKVIFYSCMGGGQVK